MSKKMIVVKVDEKAFTVTTKGDKKTFALAKPFSTAIGTDTKAIGDHLTSIREYMSKPERQARALTLVAAFDAWKEITKGGLPEFVKTFIDSTCPDKYGAAGSEARFRINSHSVFNGVETMVKKGREAIAQMKALKELKAADIDPTNEKDVLKFRKDAKQAQRDANQAELNKALIDIDTHGVTKTTIENLVVLVLHKRDKESHAITAAGEKIAQAALNAVFEAQGKRARLAKDVTPTSATKTNGKK